MTTRTLRTRLAAVLVAFFAASTLAVGASAAPPSAPPSAPDEGVIPPQQEGENQAPNPSFEELDESGHPVGWSPLWGRTEFYSVSHKRASDGDVSIEMHDTDDSRGGGAVSDSLPVEAGGSYQLAFDLYHLSGQLSPTIYFDDADGDVIEQPYQTTRGTPEAWERKTMEATAPEGAVSVRIALYSSSGATSHGFIDNVSFAAHTPPPTPEPPEGQEEALGTPITGLTNAGAGYTEDSTGRDIGVLVAGGSPSHFSAVDILTGELLMSQVLEGSTQTWSFATTPDRKVYIATSSGDVHVFDPDALTLEEIADQPFGETYFWEGGANTAGEVFFATYPGGKLLRYTPSSDTWTDHGTLVEGNSYSRALAVRGDDVFVGGGTSEPSLVRVDTATEEHQRIPLPEEFATEDMVHDVSVAGDLVLARISPSNTLLVYSTVDQQWVDSIESVVGLDASPPVQTLDNGTQRTEVLIPRIGGGMTAYDIETLESRSVSIDLGGASARGWSLQELDLDGFPGESLVTATSSGIFHIWSPETGQTHRVESDAEQTPYLIRTIDNGPGEQVWVGGYASPPGIARVDSATGATEFLPGVGQTEGFGALGDTLVMGTYPGANIYIYDTTEDWQSGTNPEPSVSIGHEQDRPVVFEAVEERMAIGTVPVGGQLGGALTFYDPESGDMDVIEEIVEDQTVISLAYRDGLLYGGTGIWGGLGIEPTTSEGQLFVYDVEAGEVVHQEVPAAGDQNVSALTFDPGGNLWGLTSNHIVRFDTETREIVERHQVLDVDDSAAYWTTRDLVWHDGALVAQASGQLFEFDPTTKVKTVIQTGGQNLAVDPNGNYYYNRGSELYRWVPGSDDHGDDRETVWIGDHDTGVPNHDVDEARTINDVLRDEDDWGNHGQFVRHVGDTTSDLAADGILSLRERGTLVRAAARSDIGTGSNP